jgi:hypothetical protein
MAKIDYKALLEKMLTGFFTGGGSAESDAGVADRGIDAGGGRN